MSAVSPQEITQATAASFAGTADPRLRQMTGALVRHLHAFVTEVKPTQDEWAAAIGFLTRVGHTCQGARQEFILLSDVLGVSMLVDALNHGDDEAATESTVLGPFYVDAAPTAAHGADIAAGAEGVPLWVDVEVTDTAGAAVAGAVVDVWQCDDEGLYDVQRGGEHALRARFVTDEAGRVCFWSIVPVAYPIPSDGPVGDLLAATGRHPWRPAHVHFMFAAAGHASLATHLFVSGDQYLTSDAVFGVKPSLIRDLPTQPAGDAPAGRRLAGPWRRLDHRFVLRKA